MSDLPHIMDLHRSPKVGAREAKNLIKQGWRLCRLPAELSYCSFGAAGFYTHCLFDGERELRQLSDKAIAGLLAKPVAELKLDTTLLLLDATFEQRAEVKAAGALWVDAFKRWACLPSEAERFQRWQPSPRLVVTHVDERIPLRVPREEVEQARAAGAFWALGSEGDRWYGLPAHAGALARWMPLPADAGALQGAVA